MTTQIYPCLWFDGKAKEAADFYCSIFPNSKVTQQSPIVTIFELNGTRFMGLDGGPMFTHSEAVSFVIECEDQKQIDHYWNSLTAGGGQESRCGWLKDKYGVSWQVVPSIMGALMSNPDRAGRVTQAFMKMNKLDIETLENA